MKTLRWSVIAAIVAMAVVLLYVAIHLRVDFFDTYELYLDARTLAESSRFYFAVSRPLGSVLLLTPLFYLERSFGASHFAFIASHIMSVLIYVALVVTAYKLFLLDHSERASLIVTGLFACNIVLLRMAPFAKEDVSGALFTGLAFYFYLRPEGRRQRNIVLAGIFSSLAASVRFNLIPLFFVVFGVIELTRLLDASGQKIENLVSKTLFLLLLPLVTIFALPMIVYPHVGLSTAFEAPVKFVNDLIGFYRANEHGEGSFKNYVFVMKAVTAPVFILSVAGAFLAIKRQYKRALPYAIWFGVFFVVHTYFIPHKEARYLLPLMIPFYYFSGFVVDFLLNHGSKRRLGVALLCLVTLAPAWGAVNELKRFSDPVYRASFEQDVSDYAKGLAHGHAIYWVGSFYAINPKDYLFDPGDDVTSIYHFAAHVVAYYAHQTVRPVGVRRLQKIPGDANVWPDAALLGHVNDGDVLIVNPEPSYTSASMPENRLPLFVERVALKSFSASARALIRIQQKKNAIQFEVNSVRDGIYLVFADSLALQKRVPLAFLRSKDGKIDFSIAKQMLPINVSQIDQLTLASLDGDKTFYLPGREPIQR